MTMAHLADDLLIGADEIATYARKTRRTIYHLASKGLIPTFKIGEVIHARKSELDRRFSANSNER